MRGFEGRLDRLIQTVPFVASTKSRPDNGRDTFVRPFERRVKRLETRHRSGDITAGDLYLALLLEDPDAIARCNNASPDCKVMRDVAAFLAGLEGNKPVAS